MESTNKLFTQTESLIYTPQCCYPGFSLTPSVSNKSNTLHPGYNNTPVPRFKTLFQTCGLNYLNNAASPVLLNNSNSMESFGNLNSLLKTTQSNFDKRTQCMFLS